MTQNALKKLAAEAALTYVKPGMIIGVGTGSTVDYFIAGLKKFQHQLEGAIASSKHTATQLQALGIPVLDPNTVADLPLYVDGTDEFNEHFQLIKGGGGAQTHEKILASQAKKFVCITDA